MRPIRVDHDGPEIVVDLFTGALEFQTNRISESVQVFLACGGKGPESSLGIGRGTACVGSQHISGVIFCVEADRKQVAPVHF